MTTKNTSIEEINKKVELDKIMRKEEESIVNSYIEGVHFTLCFMFFMITLIFTLELTYSLINMDSSDNEDIQTAKNIMTSAVVISFAMLILIVCIVLGVGYYAKNSTDKYDNISEYLNKKTGGHNIYISVRIIIFSILMFTSVILSALCFGAAGEIDNSGYKNEYEDQYNTCMDLGKTFITHFMIFTTAQIIAIFYKMLITNGTISSKTITVMEPTSSNII